MNEESRGKNAQDPVEECEMDMESLLQEAEAKAFENLDMAKRIQADYDNYRKRSQKEMEEFRKFATEGLVLELLVILDDLERALQTEDAVGPFADGVRGIHINLKKLLESKGLKEIATDGVFDPRVHDCLMTCEGDEDGQIAEVYQKGYYLGPRVIRCAKVKVTNATKKNGEGE